MERDLTMQIKYLHISVYLCDECEGPVIAGAYGIRETEVSRESALTQVGAVCLSCGNRKTEQNDAKVVRQFAPVEWTSRKKN